MTSPSDVDAQATLRARKQALRRVILARRDETPVAERATHGRTIAERLLGLDSFLNARAVLLTMSYASEWDTRPIAHHALEAGKRVGIPRVDKAARTLRLHQVVDVDADMTTGAMGIPEPLADRPLIDPQAIDWVLVPGVAFDAAGQRLGYGGGFYDRLLPLLKPETPRIVGAYELQIVDEVPAGAHDARVHMIVTERRVIEAA
ncbi:MAG TPA: 5-formyltetrahydrofolate cyclo-ligase [Casimicrobiaceae bacterium]|nr:5-formyltetrahydrofolate cyclo-ligase [Casimicrobiaceae bacterium]